MYVPVFSQSVVSNSATPWTVACQAPLSMGFSQQEQWSVLGHARLQGIFPTQRSKLGLSRCGQTLPAEPPGKSKQPYSFISFCISAVSQHLCT